MLPNAGVLNPVVHFVLQYDRSVNLDTIKDKFLSKSTSFWAGLQQTSINTTEAADIATAGRVYLENAEDLLDLGGCGVFLKSLTLDCISNKQIGNVTVELFDATSFTLESIFNAAVATGYVSSNSKMFKLLNFKLSYGYTNYVMDETAQHATYAGRDEKMRGWSRVIGNEVLCYPSWDVVITKINYKVRGDGILYTLEGIAPATIPYALTVIENAIVGKTDQPDIPPRHIRKGQKFISFVYEIAKELKTLVYFTKDTKKYESREFQSAYELAGRAPLEILRAALPLLHDIGDNLLQARIDDTGDMQTAALQQTAERETAASALLATKLKIEKIATDKAQIVTDKAKNAADYTANKIDNTVFVKTGQSLTSQDKSLDAQKVALQADEKSMTTATFADANSKQSLTVRSNQINTLQESIPQMQQQSAQNTQIQTGTTQDMIQADTAPLTPDQSFALEQKYSTNPSSLSYSEYGQLQESLTSQQADISNQLSTASEYDISISDLKAIADLGLDAKNNKNVLIISAIPTKNDALGINSSGPYGADKYALGKYRFFSGGLNVAGSPEEGINILSVDANIDNWLVSTIQATANNYSDALRSYTFTTKAKNAANYLIEKLVPSAIQQKASEIGKLFKLTATQALSRAIGESISIAGTTDNEHVQGQQDVAVGAHNMVSAKVTNATNNLNVPQQTTAEGLLNGIPVANKADIFKRWDAHDLVLNMYKKQMPFEIEIKVLGDLDLRFVNLYNSYLKLEYYSMSRGEPNIWLTGLWQLVGFKHDISAGSFTTTLKLFNALPNENSVTITETANGS